MKTIAITDSKKPNTKQEVIATNIKLLIEQLEAGHSEDTLRVSPGPLPPMENCHSDWILHIRPAQFLHSHN
jgi:hypothetical protein